jgi:hypothetical protein
LQTLLTFIISFLTFGTANATVYWAAPNGIHDISGSSTFCQRIDSFSDQAGNAPSEYGTIGAAAACAKVAGDIVNIRGNMGVYNYSNSHRIKTDDPSITPSYALHSGTSNLPTVVQGAPGDPRPVINIANWFSLYSTSISLQFRRDYITLRNVKIDASGGGGYGDSTLYINGTYNTIDNVEVTRWRGSSAVAGFYDSTGCQYMHHLTIKNSYFHHAEDNGSGYNQYAVYYNGCDALIENNVFSQTIGGGIQIYYAGSKPNNAARAIIRGNHIYDVKTTSIPRPGTNGYSCWGMALDGQADVVTRNIVDLSSCPVGGAGINHGYDSPSGNVVITNNIVINPLGYPLEVGIFNSQAVTYKIQNNILLSRSQITNIVSYSPSVITKDHNACNSDSTSCGSNMVPLVDISTCTASSSDFHLKVGSPCIDKGVSVGESYSGAAPDIGRYEFESTIASKPLPPINLKAQ